MAREVATWAAAEQLERAKTFLRKQHEGEKTPVQVKDVEDTVLRKLQALIQRELQEKIEAKVDAAIPLPLDFVLKRFSEVSPCSSSPQLQAKETEGICEAEKHLPRPPAEHVAHFLLTQRHLRQTVQVLAGGLQVQKAGLEISANDHSTEGPTLDVRTLLCHMPM